MEAPVECDSTPTAIDCVRLFVNTADAMLSGEQTPEAREKAETAYIELCLALGKLRFNRAIDMAKAFFPFDITDEQAKALVQAATVDNGTGEQQFDFNSALCVEMRRAIRQKHGVVDAPAKFGPFAHAVAAMAVMVVGGVLAYLTRK
jgi:hypothetical protein